MVSEIRSRFVVRNMLRHDPRSSHAKTTPIGASKPLRFASTTRTDVFDSLTQRAFCLVSEIRPRFVIRNMLRHDPRSSHAKTTPSGASKSLWFVNTTRTDVFDSLAQQVFCLVSEIRQGFVVRNMLRHDRGSSHAKTTPLGASKPLRHDPRYSHAKTTPIGASKPLRFANTMRTDELDLLALHVSEIRPRFVVPYMLRHDPRSSHAKTTPIGASKSLWFANKTRTDVFDSLAQQVFCLVIRDVFIDLTAIFRPEYVET
ncbi:uncharacterized protein G2W53_033674 [Senna tora]|uniref:Uncharacterized protein n=1 Tax=Senna tora TaxID=362788 RepID=A0A834SZP4_9FABA|nr:uncharacterized protein G2W53_033674 [Senna tora]